MIIVIEVYSAAICISTQIAKKIPENYLYTHLECRDSLVEPKKNYIRSSI